MKKTGAVIWQSGLDCEKDALLETVWELTCMEISPVIVAEEGVAQTGEERLRSTEKSFDAVRMGLRAIAGQCERVLLLPRGGNDVSREELRALLDHPGETVCMPWTARTWPVICLADRLLPALCAYTGEDGLRGAVRALGATVSYLPGSAPGGGPDQAPEEGTCGLQLECRYLLKKQEVIFSPEIAQLLELIAHTGSLQMASKCMQISYSKAWKTINEMERQLKTSIVERNQGGAQGGNSSLTKEGRALLLDYRRLQEKGSLLVEELFDEFLQRWL